MSRGHVRAFLAASTPKARECPTCSKGGAVTYWCPERRQWVGPTTDAPTPAAYAHMPSSEAARVRRHRHRWLGVYDP